MLFGCTVAETNTTVSKSNEKHIGEKHIDVTENITEEEAIEDSVIGDAYIIGESSEEDITEEIVEKVKGTLPEQEVSSEEEAPVLPHTSAAYKVNFDEKYGITDDGLQDSLDAGLITSYFGDFYHHNTKEFMADIFSLVPGDKIFIGGKEYTFDHIENGYTKSTSNGHGYIYTEFNSCVYYDGVTEIIMCNDVDPQWNRTIAVIY